MRKSYLEVYANGNERKNCISHGCKLGHRSRNRQSICRGRRAGCAVRAFGGIPLSAAYCASKGGLVQLIRAMAVEWAGDNICVNAVCPGYIRTAMSEKAFRIGDTYNKVLSRIPMKRIGAPEDVGKALLFLASSSSDYITGTTLNVDGGLLATAYTMDD